MHPTLQPGAARRVQLIVACVAAALAFAALLSLAGHSSIARGQTPADPHARLEQAVAAGRLDPSVAQALKANGQVAALVLHDAAAVQQRAAQSLSARGLTVDDDQALAQKAAGYSALKQQALVGGGDGVAVLRDYEHFAVQLVRFSTEVGLSEMLARPEVLAVRENRRREADLAQSLPLVNAPAANAAGFTGAGTAVAILDTGIDYTRAAFGSCIAPGIPSTTCKVVVSYDFAPYDGYLDDNGHGTNVAGVVAGVAPGAKLIGLDVFDGTNAFDDDIIAALNWVVANRSTYHIVAANMSLGVSQTYYTSPCSLSQYASPFSDLRAAGVLPVVAAGNDGFVNQVFYNGISAPACTPGALSVGAVYDSTMGAMSWRGCTDYITAADKITCFSQTAGYLGVLAPGSVITAAGVTMSGTSQATPHVAGAVAALASGAPLASVSQLQAAITSCGPVLVDPRNGVAKHRLDVLAAANQLRGVPCGGTPPPCDPSSRGGCSTPPTATVTPAPTTTVTATPQPSPTPCNTRGCTPPPSTPTPTSTPYCPRGRC